MKKHDDYKDKENCFQRGKPANGHEKNNFREHNKEKNISQMRPTKRPAAYKGNR